MDDMSAHLKTIQSTTWFFLSFCLVGWAVLVEFRPYFAGLILGTTVSLINTRHLAWRVGRLVDSAVDRGNTRNRQTGFMTRAAIAALAGLVAMRYEQVALSTTIAGLFVTQLATLVLGIRASRK